jgi:hypothetical protein
VVHTRANPSTWEAKAGGLWVREKSGLHSKPWLKKIKTKKSGEFIYTGGTINKLWTYHLPKFLPALYLKLLITFPLINSQRWDCWTSQYGCSNFYLFLVFAVLGFELGVSHLLDRYSTAWIKPPVLFTLVILEIRSHFLLRPAWTLIILFYASCRPWDDRLTPPHPTLFHWDGVLQIVLPRPAQNCNPPNFSLQSS